MSDGNSVINVGDLGKPAVVLIERISDAFEGAFKPFQMKRVAKAEAEVAVIKAKADIEVVDIQRRAIHRFFTEEVKKQENMEAITAKAIPLLKDGARPEEMENDWINSFFNECKMVSDDEMQMLWAKILAGEATEPGSFSKRTVKILASLDKRDANLFTLLCGFVWECGFPIPLIFDLNDPIYSNNGIFLSKIAELESMGLVSHDTGSFEVDIDQVLFSYFDQSILCHRPKLKKPLWLGKTMFTVAGREIRGLCEAKPIDGFFDYVVDKFRNAGVVVTTDLTVQLLGKSRQRQG